MTTNERNRLIEEHMPLVHAVLGRLSAKLPREVDREDLRSCGVLGLVDALAKWDETRGGGFGNYAQWRIRGAMLDELRRLDPSPRRLRARKRLLDGAIMALQSDLGREPTDAELCVSLNVTELQLEKWQAQQPYKMVAMDKEYQGADGDGGASLHETLSDGVEGVRERMERVEMIDELAEVTKKLPVQMRTVLAYLASGMNLLEIGKAMGFTESRICQIRHDAINRLRSKLSFTRPLAA